MPDINQLRRSQLGPVAKTDSPTRPRRRSVTIVPPPRRQPLFAQVRSELTDTLRRHRAGDRLPSEPELAASYGVSRPTIREVLRSLEHEGMVRRVHGVGTFVNDVPTKVASAVDVDLGVTEAVEAANRRLGVQVLAITEVAASADVAAALDLETGARLTWVERLILADETPAAYVVDAIPASLAARARRPYASGSVYRFLEQECGLELRGGVARITATTADRRMARMLRVPNGSALLRMQQVERTRDDVACLYSVEHYVPSVFELTVRRTRRGRSGDR
jgi:GntR family transcriptional regulator